MLTQYQLHIKSQLHIDSDRSNKNTGIVFASFLVSHTYVRHRSNPRAKFNDEARRCQTVNDSTNTDLLLTVYSIYQKQ